MTFPMMAIVCLVLYHISYRLAMYVCNVDSSELRQMVASHMEANAASYRGFVCQPVATDSKYNADTEPPTDEDEYINSVSDLNCKHSSDGPST